MVNIVMKKKLYIHIGRPKVGSTAIQGFLRTNRKTLLENGMLYPVTGERQNASHQLAAVLLRDAGKRANLPSAEDLYRDLIDEIESSSVASCVISSENFYFVQPKHVAKALADKFDVKIICYIRRQDEVLVSSYIQELRDDTLEEDERDDIDRYLNRPDRLSFLDYQDMMDKWASVFGVENIIVRVYEKGQLNGDLFNDVMDAIGLPLTDEYSKPQKRANATPSSDVLEIIKLVNRFPASDTIRKQIKRYLVEISENIGSVDRFDSTRIFSAKQKRDVLARFRKSNIATAKKYLKRQDGRLFYRDIEDEGVENAGQGSAYDELDLGRMTQIWLGMIVHQQEEFLRLEMQLNILKKNAASKK